ncbi:MAG: hypothetical protein EBX39_11980, partial [Actinobacteria bacterium]|nr:hypothetical protein [Actinomycetota bacterium]
MSGTLPVLGGLAVDLVGPIVGGEVGALAALVPQATYALSAGSVPDSLSVPLMVSYAPAADPTAPATLTIETPPSLAFLPSQSATLSIVEQPGAVRVYEIAAVAVEQLASGESGAQLSLTGSTPYLTEGPPGLLSTVGAVSGTYSLVDGTYSFGGSNLPGTLAGLDAPTDLSFSRSSEGSIIATQESLLTPGIFDSDVTVTVSGTIGVLDATPITATASVNTLSGSVADVELRGLSGDVTFSVAPTPASQLTLNDFNAFQSSVSFVTEPEACILWDGDATLEGIVYGSGDTTYYTLAGTTATDLSIPVSLFTRAENTQPIVLSNEVIPGSPPTTSGLTIAYPFSTTAFSGFGQVSLDFATCALSVGGTAIMQFGALGPAGQALEQALSGPTGLQVQAGSLFGPSGQLPPNVVIARAVYQAEQVAGTLAAQAQEYVNTAAKETRTAQGMQQQLTDAQTAAQQAQAAQSAAQTKLNNTQANAYLESVAAVYSEDALQAEAAQQNAEVAFASVDAASTELAAATT